VGKLENQWRRSVSRRNALQGLAGFLAGSPYLGAQQDTFRDHSRVPGINELVTAFDFEPVAYAKIPREAYDYTALGVEGEFTLRRNREAFDWVDIVPRAVANVSSVNTSTEILGIKMDFPIMIAPTAGHAQLHPEGELATHRGATAAKTPMIVSTVASFPMDKIAAAAQGPLWFQLYAGDTEDRNRELVETAVGAGCRAVALTVDVQYTSHRERNLHNRNLGGALSNPERARSRRRAPSPPSPYGITGQTPYIHWGTIDELRGLTKVPLLLKGILTAEDAVLAVERGVDAIVVSNHGGRYLDYAPSTLEVLPEIVDAVKGRIPVLIDSGFRRGSDIFKALALGAKAVCLGRVPRWGLAAYGEAGVQRILEILQAELVLAMAHAGRPTLDAIDRAAVRTNFP
jgi:isopentenyl diphosphate isomerase/L-lactate dehydrogenase-like FMN-dependent dehydrogenase